MLDEGGFGNAPHTPKHFSRSQPDTRGTRSEPVQFGRTDGDSVCGDCIYICGNEGAARGECGGRGGRGLGRETKDTLDKELELVQSGRHVSQFDRLNSACWSSCEEIVFVWKQKTNTTSSWKLQTGLVQVKTFYSPDLGLTLNWSQTRSAKNQIMIYRFNFVWIYFTS